MVNMAHNADYRRSWNHIRLVLFIFFQKFTDHIHLFFRLCDDIVVQSDLLSLFKVDLMVYRYHDALHKQLLHDHGRLHLHCFRQLADRQLLRKGDFLYFRFLLFLFRLRSRFLKSLRKSGKCFSSTLVRSVSRT